MEQVGEQHGDKQQVGKQQAGNQQAGEKQQQDGEQRIGVRVQQTGEHGDATDTFIPRKLSRGGKRFGFVRLKSRTDALRIIERLNGFILYGYRLTVKMARFKKGVYKEKSSETQGTKNWMNDTVGRVKTVMESGNQNRGKLKRISGHVMEEELWKLRRCLVGEIGSMIVEVGVKELGFSDISTEGVMAKVVPVKKDNDVQDSGSTLGYSSEAEKNDSSEAGRSGSRVEDEALNEMCADKRFNNCQAQGSERTSCQLGEFELIGGGFKVGYEVASDIQEKQCGAAENVEGVDCIKLCDTDAKGDNWAGTGCEGPDGTKEIMGAKKDDQKVEGHDMVSSRALEDVGNMGLNGVNTEKGSWAKALKDKMNIGVAWNRGGLEDLPKN
ncbi:hypothetical protein V6N13_019667 [Hibiscus sabdariffa]